MNIKDIRRKNLASLVKGKKLSDVAKQLGKPSSQISDMLKGRKTFGEKVAREMEKNYAPHLPAGWLDREDMGDTDRTQKTIIEESAEKVKESLLKIEQSVAEQMAVCNAYRLADDETRDIVDYILADSKEPKPGWVTSDIQQSIDAMRYAVIKWRRLQEKKTS